MKKQQQIIYFIIALLSILPVKAQERESEQLLMLMEKQFVRLDSLIFCSPNESVGISSTLSLYQPKATDSLLNDAIEQETRIGIRKMKSQTGLQINGQTYYRLDDGFGIDEEDAVSRYKAKIQAELGWDFLHSAIYKRSGKENEIRLQGKIKRNEYDRRVIQEAVLLQKEAFRLEYDSLLAGTLLHHLQNLSLLYDAQEYLLRSEHISSDALLNIINEKAEAERILATIPGSYSQSADLSIPRELIIDVDTAALLKDIQTLHSDIEHLDLQIALLDQQRKNTDYWQSMSLKPFIRYSYYIRPLVPNSSNIDAGVSFKLPLSKETKHKKHLLQAQQQVLEIEKQQLSEKLHLGIKLIIADIERLNKGIEGEYKRLIRLKHFLKTRREGYNNRIGEYSRLTRIKEYNSFLQSREKLFDYQYRRNCLLADLQLYAENSIFTYLTVKKILNE